MTTLIVANVHQIRHVSFVPRRQLAWKTLKSPLVTWLLTVAHVRIMWDVILVLMILIANGATIREENVKVMDQHVRLLLTPAPAKVLLVLLAHHHLHLLALLMDSLFLEG
jgi:hypothetical protein